jgi:hypothetical protein
MAALLTKKSAVRCAKICEFVAGEINTHDELRPGLATPNTVRLDLRTLLLRDYGKPDGMPTVVEAPRSAIQQ